MKKTLLLLYSFIPLFSFAQIHWQNVSDSFGTLPKSIRVFKTLDSLDGKPNIAFYVEVDLKDKNLDFILDTVQKRRITPDQYFQKNNHPFIVMNTSFFSYERNESLNLGINKKKIVSYNEQNIPLKGKDTFLFKHPFTGSFGIFKNRKADIAYTFSDPEYCRAYASQQAVQPMKDSINDISKSYLKKLGNFKKWKANIAFGGGPVLVQNGIVSITNNEEMKFTGKTGLDDKHPRTLVGYTANNKMILMVVQGRFPGIAEGASLPQCAALMISTNCIEALNLDGGGSSCLLVNGKNTITPSDKKGEQRPIPAAFIVK